MFSNKLSNKCNIRLQGEISWDEVEEWRKVYPCVLVQRYLEDHPEWYGKAVMLDGTKKMIFEVKPIDADDSELETYEVDIGFKYDVKKI